MCVNNHFDLHDFINLNFEYDINLILHNQYVEHDFYQYLDLKHDLKQHLDFVNVDFYDRNLDDFYQHVEYDEQHDFNVVNYVEHQHDRVYYNDNEHNHDDNLNTCRVEFWRKATLQ